jgi:hypothetical protein
LLVEVRRLVRDTERFTMLSGMGCNDEQD